MTRYKDMGMYFSPVSDYMQEFKNVHIVLQDDLAQNTTLELKKIYNFLQVKNFQVDTKKKYNVGVSQWNQSLLKRFFISESLLKNFLKNILIKEQRFYFGN